MIDDVFQSTLSVRRATYFNERYRTLDLISIHALRKESDFNVAFLHLPVCISIHALRKESDLTSHQSTGRALFQSTLSVRRATVQLDIFVHFLRRKPAAWL